MSLSLFTEIHEYTRKMDSSSDSEKDKHYPDMITWGQLFEKLQSNRMIFNRALLEIFFKNAENRIKANFMELLSKINSNDPFLCLGLIDIFWKYEKICDKNLLVEETIVLLSRIESKVDTTEVRKKT